MSGYTSLNATLYNIEISLLATDLGDGAAEADRDEGPELHHLEQQEAETEAECQGVQEVAAQIRLLKLILESKLQYKIPIGHPIIAWIIEFAPHSLNFFSVGRDGKTPYERLKGRRFRVPMAEFGVA